MLQQRCKAEAASDNALPAAKVLQVLVLPTTLLLDGDAARSHETHPRPEHVCLAAVIHAFLEAIVLKKHRNSFVVVKRAVKAKHKIILD